MFDKTIRHGVDRVKRVLFVDDEARVLQGLRRMLYSQKKEWDMTFAESGEEALALFDSRSFDVIVTDMRMPGMDGAELLQHVLERNPEVARIVLSGHAEQSAAVRAAGIAHQFLAKPCDADELRRAVARTCALRERLSNRELLERITGMGQLPSLPEIFEELQAELNSDEPSIARAGEIVSRDIGMSAKILQLVNSAFFGLRREIDSVAEAASLLGTDVIRDLVLSSAVFEVLDTENCPLPMESLWQHSISAGCVARAIGRVLELDKRRISESAQAAMLLEAGRIALATRFPEPYEKVVAACAAGKDLIDAETDVFGCGHPEVGGYLLGLWSLCDAVVEAVTFHHDPGAAQTVEGQPLAVAYAADVLVTAHRDAVDPDTLAQRLSAVNLDSRCADLWQTTCSTIGIEGEPA